MQPIARPIFAHFVESTWSDKVLSKTLFEGYLHILKGNENSSWHPHCGNFIFGKMSMSPCVGNFLAVHPIWGPFSFKAVCWGVASIRLGYFYTGVIRYVSRLWISSFENLLNLDVIDFSQTTTALSICSQTLPGDTMLCLLTVLLRPF